MKPNPEDEVVVKFDGVLEEQKKKEEQEENTPPAAKETYWEVFERLYYDQWCKCMELAKKQLLKECGEPLNQQALCAATATLFITLNQNQGKINNEMNKG